MKINIKNLFLLLSFTLTFTLQLANADVPIQGSVKQVELSEYHTCAVTTANKLYCWGRNNYGQLGDGSTDDSYLPIEILSDVTYVKLGLYHTCALTIQGELLCWGNNENGQVGKSKDTDTTLPLSILTDVAQVDLADFHTCAINVNGKLYCWGKNAYGQIGNGTSQDCTAPYHNNSLKNIIQVSIGGEHSCAVNFKNELYCWGDNRHGQVGNGDKNNQSMPRKINLANVRYVNTGYEGHTCAITTSGDLYCWGRNDYKQIGNGQETDQITPTKVLENIKKLRASRIHTCAIANDNTEHLWGGIRQGGNRYVIIDLKDPDYEPENVDIVKMSLGADHTCELNNSGELECVGYNANGQLGDGTTKSKAIPVKVLGGSGVMVSDVSLGANHSCAILATGALYCWGKNDYGQVGNQTTDDQNTPYLIFDGTGSSPTFSENCSNHWNSANLNNTCTTEFTNSCNNDGIYGCFNGEDIPGIMCRPANCCENSKYSLIDTTCHSEGYGICQTDGTYYCAGQSAYSNVLCDAAPSSPLPAELCNGLDDDCDNETDEDFNIGDECIIENVGVGEYECLNESESHCVLVSTFTSTPTPTNTFTATSTATETNTPTQTYTSSSTYTPSHTATSTCTYTQSNTFTATATFTNSATATSTYTPTRTYTPSSTQTPTSTYTSSSTFTPTQTFTNTPTATFTSTFTNTSTSTNTATNTPTNTFSNTYTFTSTNTPTFTQTYTSSSTFTFTNTYTNTNTFTHTNTPTFTATPTPFPSIIDPKTDFPAPLYKWGSTKRIVTIFMQQFEEARLNRHKANTKGKYKYLVQVKKIKRYTKDDTYYPLKKAVGKLSHRAQIRFKKLEKGVYTARYRVIITKGKVTKKTKWSQVVTFQN